MSALENWYNESEEHAAKHNLESPNRFSISRLARPPQLYRLPGTTVTDPSRPREPGRKQDWPTQNELIDGINNAINKFNTAVRTANNEILGSAGKRPVVPGLDLLGMRTKRSGLVP